MGTMKKVYARVTERLIEQMEEGIAPWVLPWTRDSAIRLPYNALTGRSYSGFNVLLLWDAAMRSRFGSPRWVTFKQAKMMGGHVRKGEKGVQLLFCAHRADQTSDEQEDEPVSQRGPLVRLYTAFNLDQTEGIAPVDATAEDVTTDDGSTIPALVAAAGVPVVHRGGEACYLPVEDVVRMPPRRTFRDRAGYDATLAHEATHWTGHPKRLDRALGNRFGNALYAREELVAEIGSAFLCAEMGVEGRLQHAAYLDHWVRQLKEEPRLLVRAASKAQEAVRYLRKLAAGDSGATSAA
ncbi:MAG: ArdC family protein [Myxococcota bacterium]